MAWTSPLCCCWCFEESRGLRPVELCARLSTLPSATSSLQHSLPLEDICSLLAWPVTHRHLSPCAPPFGSQEQLGPYRPWMGAAGWGLGLEGVPAAHCSCLHHRTSVILCESKGGAQSLQAVSLRCLQRLDPRCGTSQHFQVLQSFGACSVSLTVSSWRT